MKTATRIRLTPRHPHHLHRLALTTAIVPHPMMTTAAHTKAPLTRMTRQCRELQVELVH